MLYTTFYLFSSLTLCSKTTALEAHIVLCVFCIRLSPLVKHLYFLVNTLPITAFRQRNRANKTKKMACLGVMWECVLVQVCQDAFRIDGVLFGFIVYGASLSWQTYCKPLEEGNFEQMEAYYYVGRNSKCVIIVLIQATYRYIKLSSCMHRAWLLNNHHLSGHSSNTVLEVSPDSHVCVKAYSF